MVSTCCHLSWDISAIFVRVETTLLLLNSFDLSMIVLSSSEGSLKYENPMFHVAKKTLTLCLYDGLSIVVYMLNSWWILVYILFNRKLLNYCFTLEGKHRNEILENSFNIFKLLENNFNAPGRQIYHQPVGYKFFCRIVQKEYIFRTSCLQWACFE